MANILLISIYLLAAFLLLPHKPLARARLRHHR